MVEQHPKKRKIQYTVNNIKVDAYLYTPNNQQMYPCVVMNSGYGSTQNLLLPIYAQKFAEHGIATFTYDYRHWGESEGIPRQLHDHKLQLEDLKAAISTVKEIDEISKIAIWGVSGGGGYGFNVAANDNEIKCIISLCPSLNGKTASKLAFKREPNFNLLKLPFHGLFDVFKSKLGFKAHHIPLVVPGGDFGLISSDESYNQLLEGADHNYINKVCARSIFTGNNYNALSVLDGVNCNVLLIKCELDVFVSNEDIDFVSNALGKKVTTISLNYTHSDIYSKKNFEEVFSYQIDFLKKNLFD